MTIDNPYSHIDGRGCQACAWELGRRDGVSEVLADQKFVPTVTPTASEVITLPPGFRVKPGTVIEMVRET